MGQGDVNDDDLSSEIHYGYQPVFVAANIEDDEVSRFRFDQIGGSEGRFDVRPVVPRCLLDNLNPLFKRLPCLGATLPKAL